MPGLTLAELNIVLKAVGISATKSQLRNLQSQVIETDNATQKFNLSTKNLNETLRALKGGIGGIILYRMISDMTSLALATDNVTEKQKKNQAEVKRLIQDYKDAKAEIGQVFVAALAEASKQVDNLAGRINGLTKEQIESIRVTKEQIKIETELHEKKLSQWLAQADARDKLIGQIEKENRILKAKTDLDKEIEQINQRFIGQQTELFNSFDTNNNKVIESIEGYDRWKESQNKLNENWDIAIKKAKEEATAINNTTVAIEKRIEVQDRFNRLINQGINPNTGRRLAQNTPLYETSEGKFAPIESGQNLAPTGSHIKISTKTGGQ